MKIYKGCAHREIEAPLFDKTKPAHHKTDPPTSKLAEEKVNKLGTRAKQCREVLKALKRHNGRTSAELAYLMSDDTEESYQRLRIIYARRLPDLTNTEPPLVKRGQTRFCAATKQQCVTWWII